MRLRPGESIFDQLLFAAKKALVAGEFAPGQAFPSVRMLAAELKIHPNTAHKVVQFLIQEGWLESRQGVGTVVAQHPKTLRRERPAILRQHAEEMVVEAKRLGLELDEVVEIIESEWAELVHSLETKRT
jgi:GntR family transcriptional regulator